MRVDLSADDSDDHDFVHSKQDGAIHIPDTARTDCRSIDPQNNHPKKDRQSVLAVP